MVKNLPCNAGDTGLIPGQGTRIPHAMGQLSLCTATLQWKIMHDVTKNLCAPTRTGRTQINNIFKKENQLISELFVVMSVMEKNKAEMGLECVGRSCSCQF